MADGRPAPPLAPLGHTQYVDNFAAFSQDFATAEAAAVAVDAQMKSVGLPTHGVEASVGGA
eukprot:3318210-Pyramimonas_sp.AAC.1